MKGFIYIDISKLPFKYVGTEDLATLGEGNIFTCTDKIEVNKICNAVQDLLREFGTIPAIVIAKGVFFDSENNPYFISQRKVENLSFDANSNNVIIAGSGDNGAGEARSYHIIISPNMINLHFDIIV